MPWAAIIPAITTTAGVVGGAIKNAQDMAQYKKDMEQRKKRRTFAAFTGDMPDDSTKPQRPSSVSNIMGMGLLGAKFGMGLNGMMDNPWGGGATTSNVAGGGVPTMGTSPYSIAPSQDMTALMSQYGVPYYGNPYSGGMAYGR